MKNATNWNLMRSVEIGIQRRLGRAVMLDDLSATDLEKLDHLVKQGSDEYLSKTLNEILTSDEVAK